MRREFLNQEKAKRRRQKHVQQEKTSTEDVYKEIRNEMGDNYYKGYQAQTSEEDEEEIEDFNETENEEPADEAENNSSPDKEEEALKELEEAIKPRWYILSARSGKRFWWDIIIIIFAIINAITLPFDIAWTEEMKKIDVIRIMDLVTTSLFCVDILFGFFTSYINVSSGDEIFGMRMIAMNYIFAGPFIIDILSTFPID